LSTPTLLALILAVPFAAAVGILASHAHTRLRDGITLGAGVLLFLLVAALAMGVTWDAPPRYVLAEPVAGLPLALSVEPLGLVFALVASFLWPVTSVYAFGYMNAHGETHQTRFYAAFSVSLGATMGVALADNMFSLFIFYELLTVATYPLVTHAGTDEARRAGRVYLGLLMTTSIAFMLLAMVWTWNLTGTLDFTVGGILAPETDGVVAGVLLLLYVLGTGKAALMPFHRWLPAAMVAPTPVSALLHAVAVVKAGVFTVLKVAVYVFGIDLIAELSSAWFLAHLAGLTVLLASLVAMTKDNLKARLAYSTVSQLGYIVLGAMLGVAAGTLGGAMHIAMHAFGKITLFFCAGAILVAAHKTRVSELDGIGRRMPLTMAAFFVGALSIVGLPPTGGTWSKWVLVQGTLDADAWVLTAVLLVSSVLNVLYLVVIPVRAFVYPPASGNEGIREAPRQCLIAMALTATGCLLLFLAPDHLYQLAEEIIR
jgi:multicomponent Na+:H+ antiporter subunit D